MKSYMDLVRHILVNGENKVDRTGTGTRSVFGYQLRHDLRTGFPLLTTKKVYFKSMLYELLWFIKGATNTQDGLNSGIWDAWAGPSGELGPVYGYQWRKWDKFTWDESAQAYQKTHIDQLAQAIETIKANPYSRRIIVSAWNVADIERMVLPPCHAFFQFYVTIDGHLDLQLYQRSADVAVGVPFNIASYSLLLMMVAQECGLVPRFFVHTLGDAHIYQTHLGGLEEQLTREEKGLPSVKIENKPFFELEFEDFTLEGYDPHPFIRFPIAI
ncbi:MAG: thymidylate synthase [Candidatus Margulisbacteria bacterium]|nr:thymidylate synthase [Candidatus Margulisiibacteriota bacterium]